MARIETAPPADLVAPLSAAPPLRAWPPSPAQAMAVAGALALAGAALAWALGRWVPQLGAAGAALAGALAAGVPLALLLAQVARQAAKDRALVLSSGTVDAATGVSTRGPFMVLAAREFARARRYGTGAALLLVDVDRFRRLTEDHDGEAADLVLREIAASIQATLRGADALARFGPAQIAVFLAHADPLGSLDVAERVRERVELLEMAWHDQRLRATVSVGVVMMRAAHLSLQSVVDDAEAALGAARHAGGNCVRSAPVDPRRPARPGHGPAVDGNRAAGGGA